MNRFFTRFVLLAALVLTWGQLSAQFTTTFAKNVNPGQQSGFYYSLPQTMLQLDFVIEETQCEPGPLAGYSSMYFSMDEAVDYPTTTYRMIDVKMSRLVTSDPNATFFVSVSTGRGGSKAAFDVLPNGIIRSVGAGNVIDATELAKTEPEMLIPSAPCKAETTNSGFISLMTSGKTDAQLAREAADKIAEIRKAKMDLLGFYETAYLPETFKEMNARLDKMEEDYLSLFLGKRIKKTVVKTVYVVPSKEVSTQTVAKFSENEGLSVGTAGAGNLISVQTLPLNTTAAINAPSQSAVESMSYENKLFYRVPEMANVKVSCNNNTLLEERVIVNQLGVLMMAPFTNARMDFDTTTGQIINLRMQ